ncbi:DUF5047 domain-containing protein [Streptomyces zaomyceticus]|uniref:DUF5047 domain-containing protein n=1 Tax=Streptomyces zaomyceticus TaxID=68286 RepID=UPI00342D3068
MYAVSAAFLAALATSHRMVTTVDAFYGGSLVAANIPVADGSVTVDRGSKTRRSLSLTVSDPALLPWDTTDTLAAYGQTLVVKRGIRFPSGAEELVPLGTFRINEPSGDTLFGPVTISGTSAEADVIDDRFQVPTSTRGYTGCFDAISALIHQSLPAATVVNLTAGTRNPTCAVADWDADGDRWDAIVQVATAMQAEVYVDAIGRFVVADRPSVLSGSVVWDIAEGDSGTLISSSRRMSRTAVYNAVLAMGENTASGTAPVSAVARDTDPLSPTVWGGPFGKVTKKISSALWTTVGACQAAADYALVEATAPNVQTSISSLPNPALDAGDIIRLSHSGRKELHMVQSITIPLTVDGEFSVTLRGRKEDDS